MLSFDVDIYPSIDRSYNHWWRAVGGIITNSASEFVTSFPGSVNFNLCLEAEVESLVQCIHLLQLWWKYGKIIESDSKILVEALDGITRPPWTLGCRCESVMEALKDIEIVYVFREVNMSADLLCKLGHSFTAPTLISYLDLLLSLRRTIVNECKGHR